MKMINSLRAACLYIDLMNNELRKSVEKKRKKVVLAGIEPGTSRV